MIAILCGDYGDDPYTEFNSDPFSLKIYLNPDIIRYQKRFNNSLSTYDVIKRKGHIKRIELVSEFKFKEGKQIVIRERIKNCFDPFWVSRSEIWFFAETIGGMRFIAKASNEEFNIFLEQFYIEEEEFDIKDEKKESINSQIPINLNDPWEESTKASEKETINERKLEPCKFGSLEEIEQVYELECHESLYFNGLNITSLIDENGNFIRQISGSEIDDPKTLDNQTDYLELIRFLKTDIIKSKFEYTKEVGKLLSICAKYACKVIFCSEIKTLDESQTWWGFYSNNNNGESSRQIVIRILTDPYGSYSSAAFFLETLRHEVFHLIQDVYGFGILGIDIFDEATENVFNNSKSQNYSIEELICELEAESADKIPFMTCDIESLLSESSTIEGSKYAASPLRKKTIELIAKEKRVPIYSSNDKSISQDKKEIEELFQDELYRIKTTKISIDEALEKIEPRKNINAKKKELIIDKEKQIGGIIQEKQTQIKQDEKIYSYNNSRKTTSEEEFGWIELVIVVTASIFISALYFDANLKVMVVISGIYFGIRAFWYELTNSD
tara:strand:- start:989 stop:2656 length:1668 start_codon:yes stop_codon:yes gene_type:complete